MAHDGTLRQVYVHPGETRVVKQPALLRTVLGSCVGVTFLVTAQGFAALCHPMLPQSVAARLSKPDAKLGRRYVDFAIREIGRRLDALGMVRREAVVKLFGGGDVLLTPLAARRPTVGRQNVEMARRVLAEEGFAIAASSVGGSAGIRLEFNTETGEVRVWRLR